MLVRPGHPSRPPIGAADAVEDLAPAGVLNPRSLVLMGRRHRLLIGAIASAAILTGLAVCALLPSRYTATVVLLVDPRQQRVVQSEAVLPGIGNDSAAVESQIEVIQSTTLARRVVEDLRLGDTADFQPTFLRRIAEAVKSLLPGRRADDAEGAMRRTVSHFEDNLRVLRRGQTYVLEVSFTSRDADQAAAVANALAKDYLNQQVTLKRDATQEASDWLDGRLDDLRRQADAADRAVADYKAAHSIVDTGDRSGQHQTLIEQQLADLNGQLVQARVKEGDAQSRYDQIESASPNMVGNGGLPEALQSPVILALRTQFASTSRMMAQLKQIYGPRYPAVLTAQAEIAESRRLLSAELGRVASGLRKELGSARARVRALEAGLKVLKAQSADTDQDTVKLRELQREAEATRTVLQQFLLRYKETSEQQSLQVPDARVLSPASPPLTPSSPSAMVVMGLSTILGLVAGFGIAVVADRWSGAVRTAREVEDLLSVPVLALLPASPLQSFPGAGLRHGAAPDRGRLDRLALDHPLSRFGESIRGLAIRLRGPLDGRVKVVLITSAVPGEGASTVAANVARVMARGGIGTLLVQADLRQPAGVGASRGLYDALRDGVSPLSLLRQEPDSGLVLLPAGRIDDPGRGSELLMSSAMERALEVLRPKFDHIVIDAAPLLSSVDSHALLDLADAAVLVVAWDATPRDSLEAAMTSVGPNANKFTGIVLNWVDFDLYAKYDDMPQMAPAFGTA